jgi:hypothetical protein
MKQRHNAGALWQAHFTPAGGPARHPDQGCEMRSSRILAFSVLLLIVLASVPAWARETDSMAFLGLRALVVRPDVLWWEWDAAIYGALEERGFDVTYGSALDDADAFSRYDLVALGTRRHLSPAEEVALKRYLSEGGAVYGSWGGPMEAPAFMQEVLKAKAPTSVYLTRVTLLEGPLVEGMAERDLPLAEHVGHQDRPASGWEMVAMEALPGGVPVAKDEAGRVLGVLSEYGRGRTAVLGFGPEQEKYLQLPALGPTMLDNLLAWLLADRLRSGPRQWSNRVSVALPARAEVVSVELEGRAVRKFTARRVGSVRRVELAVDGVKMGEEADICIRYRPLTAAGNVQTLIHLPWGTLRGAADSPARLAEYLKSLHATIVQPLLRGSNGQAWYRGMAEDTPDEKLVTSYRGNFLADLIRECHQRGIKVIGGIYFDNTTRTRTYPEAIQRDASGAEKKNEYGSPLACFNQPKGQQYNLATIDQLLAQYQLDGVILDDNYELDWYVNNCFCDYCEAGFKKYCGAHGIPYQGPSQSGDYSAPGPRHDYRRERTRALVAKVRQLARSHGRPAGGWVSVTLDATHLAGSFDFLGGMAYTSPPRSARAVLPRLGETDFWCLLWAPHADPAAMEREVREAIHAGCATVGFWVMGEDGGYRLDAAREEAIRRAFAGVEGEWLGFYRDQLLTGDGRFAVAEATVGRDELRLRLRNTGRRVARRLQGKVALDLPGATARRGLP